MVRQALCSEYNVGVGIGGHKDKSHFGKIFGSSLAVPTETKEEHDIKTPIQTPKLRPDARKSPKWGLSHFRAHASV